MFTSTRDKLTRFIGLGVLLTAFAGSAAAATPGGYLGFSMGTSEVDTLNVDDTSFKLTAGYTANQNLGIEIQVISFGEFFNGIGNVDVTGVSFDGVGYLPVSSQVSLFAKFGMISYTAEFYGLEDTGSELMYGLGGQFDVSSNLAIRAEYENYNDISGSDISMLSAGIIYTF
jgi:OOP family OmpA-OmpF porin